jgi:hypothetical protein
LSYLKAFSNPESDTSEIAHLLGMMQLGILTGGPQDALEDVTGFPHGLRALRSNVVKRGVGAVVMAGNGSEWLSALSNAGKGSENVVSWGMSCFTCLSKNNLSELFGKLVRKNTGFSLTLV